MKKLRCVSCSCADGVIEDIEDIIEVERSKI